MRHVQLEERRALGALQWPSGIGVLLPVRQPRQEVRLRRPEDAILHRPMIFQALQQHVVELGGANDLAHRKSGKAVEQSSLVAASALQQQELRVLLEARDEVIDMVAKLGSSGHRHAASSE